MRCKEIAGLKINTLFDSVGNIKEIAYLSAEQTKGSKGRKIIIGKKLQKSLSDYYKSQRLDKRPASRPLIPSQKGGHFRPNALVQLFGKLYADAGIEGASSHSGRRSLASSLAAKGTGVRVLQEILGHRSIATTQKYIDVQESMLVSAVNLL
ncbi:tyrosine-type recombinase/integrase [uncultured Microbulbifer sp.]|uniref:tyrosine-type recombinase/integrase n=1 Tax=uncultured Microbulbifer sp. TaxID=348147 RepID=UPI002635C67F|nr:tyrosine-type recombinase/integrase [uncultured Microbulbifer sp.]